jgi:hypothetical protein
MTNNAERGKMVATDYERGDGPPGLMPAEQGSFSTSTRSTSRPTFLGGYEDGWSEAESGAAAPAISQNEATRRLSDEYECLENSTTAWTCPACGKTFTDVPCDLVSHLRPCESPTEVQR